MPKVYTRATVATDNAAATAHTQRAVLRSYYCLCGDFLLVLQGKLERLPRRRTDGSYILRSRAAAAAPARKFKLTAQPGPRVLVQRGGDAGKEIRQVFCCGRCKTPVAYQAPPPPAGAGPFLYLYKGAMTELQGRVPADAFAGERELAREIKAEANREASKLARS